ncbi:hypothetical protein AIIKEEIJ_00119 [Rhodococcus sp. YH1]|nr:hypothetical protein [Rhodococcus sp. YH1]
MNPDASLLELPPYMACDGSILDRHDLRGQFDEGDVSPEIVVQTREFDADGTGSDDQQ